MDNATPLTVDLDETELAELAAIAAREDRTAADVAADAVRAKLARNREYLAAIEEGVADVRAGRTVSREEFLAHRAEQRSRYRSDRQG